MNDSYQKDYTVDYTDLSDVNYTDLFDESSVSEQARYSMQVVSMVLYSITFFLGIPGNALVIWVAGVKMKTVNTIWYVNLAVADLLCCLTIPFLIAEMVLDHHFPYGAAMCKVLNSVIILNMYASVFTLTMISLDRFTMVIWPLRVAKNHRSIVRTWLLCGLAWLLALLLSLPSLIHREIVVHYNNETTCSYVGNQSAIHITRAVLGFLIPLLVIVVCYLLIARRVSGGLFKSQKALRIMVGVVTAFFTCWMPYHTVGLVIDYGEESSAEVAQAVDPLAISLAYINSCLNPVLYVFMGQNFKERVRVSLRHTGLFQNAFSEDATCSSVGSKRQMSRVVMRKDTVSMYTSISNSHDNRTMSISNTMSNEQCLE